MEKNEEDFLKELLAMFKIEAEEHIKTISSGLLEIEKMPVSEERATLIETIYREAHSLKGAARAVNLNDVESLCQSLESIFAKWKHQQTNPPAEFFDILHNAVDILPELINSPEENDISDIMHQLSRLENEEIGNKATAKQTKPEEKDASIKQTSQNPKVEKEKTETTEEPSSVQKSENKTTTKTNPFTAAEKSFFSETVRIPVIKLDSLLRQTEEMISSKIAVSQRAEDLLNIVSLLNFLKKEWEKLSPEVKILRRTVTKNNPEEQINIQLNRLLKFLDWNQEQIKNIEAKLIPTAKLIENNSRTLGGMVNALLEDMKSILMLPFSTLLKILPKVVRDLSRDENKEVELIVRGSTTEVDRRILEEMKDPFIHLLRNCIDHGIEKPEERIKKGKPRRGTITIDISQLGGGKVEILVSDDGGGIDIAKVKNIAVKRGIISEAEASKLNDKDALFLIFQSDVSTSPIITEISGRGLGLAIVREKVEKLGGKISIDTKLGAGTTFRIVLPITLATFRGILIKVSGQNFVVPTINVERVMRIKSETIKTVENKETITLDNQAVSFVRLSDVLELPRKEENNENSFIQTLILNATEKRIAFGIDEVITEQEVLVKPLGKQLSRVRNITGATVLGTGEIVPILNVSDLMKSAVKVVVSHEKEAKEEGKDVKKSILIAEDSITSRTLLKNILESAGYYVKTSVDGVDAFTTLKTENFDLVVSDIEMPRMNGFELVSKIRSDKKTSGLPVVLVTALESREDRERGIEVGANAYIVKRSFDQSNLLEVIKKLI